MLYSIFKITIDKVTFENKNKFRFFCPTPTIITLVHVLFWNKSLKIKRNIVLKVLLQPCYITTTVRFIFCIIQKYMF